MMNYANSTDVYKIWADTLAYGFTQKNVGDKYYCAFAGRRDGKTFAISDDDVKVKYYDSIKITGRVPEALSGAMGDRMFIAVFPTKKELDAFYADVLKTV